MTFGLRFLVIALAAFGLTGALASLGVRWWTRRAWREGDLGAKVIFQLRLAPAALSIVALVLATASFQLFEPRGGHERTGLLLALCASLAGATLATTILRFVRLWHGSRRAISLWMRSAEPISLPGIDVPAYRVDSTFPVVAVAGVFRPRLLIAASVLDACPPDELHAILAHERWHLRNGDNLRRLLLATAPDVLMWTPLSRRLNALWQSAAEDAADADAALSGPAHRVSLAEALIRIGRLAPAGIGQADLPASALFRGENLERRIRRLLDPEVDLGRHRERSFWLIAVAASLLIVSPLALRPIHELMEAAVAFLP